MDGWLSWILQTLVVSNFMTSCLPHPGRVLCKREGFFPHEMTNIAMVQFVKGFFGESLLLHLHHLSTFTVYFVPCPGLQSWNFEDFTGTSSLFQKKVEAPNKKKTTKCRNPYDGM